MTLNEITSENTLKSMNANNTLKQKQYERKKNKKTEKEKEKEWQSKKQIKGKALVSALLKIYNLNGVILYDSYFNIVHIKSKYG